MRSFSMANVASVDTEDTLSKHLSKASVDTLRAIAVHLNLSDVDSADHMTTEFLLKLLVSCSREDIRRGSV